MTEKHRLDSAGTDDGAAGSKPLFYRNYMLFILVLIYVFNGIDRSIMWVLLEPIKADLHLTDTELGWLSGFAFGVFYALAGIPIGLLADRSERRRIIAVAVGVWSVMTSLCGVTSGFWTLFGARVLVGTAESGAPPASISFISDLYPPRLRATAIAVYMSGSSAALVVTYAAGSWISARLGWRAGFLIAGIPGLVLALLVWCTFKEPPRGRTGGNLGSPPRFLSTLKHLSGRMPVRLLFLGVVISSIASVGLSTFMISFLIRSHHLTLTHAGGLIALSQVFAVVCIAGVGRLCDKLVVKDARWTMWLPAIIVGFGLPLALMVTLSSSMTIVYAALPLLSAVGASQMGPLYAFLQSTVETRMRATTMSIAYALQNLIGIGLGALLVGVISDHLTAAFGADSLRYAMACVSALFLSAAVFYFAASFTLRGDLRKRRLQLA